VLTAALAFIAAFLCLLPIVWLLISSFRPESEVIGSPYRLTGGLTIEHYRKLADFPNFGRIMANSFIVAITTAAATACLSFPAGYLLARFRFKGRKALQILSVLGYLFAPAVLALPYFQLLTMLGLTASLPGIIFAHISFCLPFSLAVTDLIVRSVPVSIEEVAMLSGGSLLHRIVFIVIPAARYQFGALLLLVFTISWKEFFFAFLLSGSNTNWTLPVLLGSQYSGDAISWPLLCAMSTVLVLPAALLLMAGKIERALPLAASSDRG
jgi:multiple sugar transport system permease protein